MLWKASSSGLIFPDKPAAVLYIPYQLLLLPGLLPVPSRPHTTSSSMKESEYAAYGKLRLIEITLAAGGWRLEI